MMKITGMAIFEAAEFGIASFQQTAAERERVEAEGASDLAHRPRALRSNSTLRRRCGSAEPPGRDRHSLAQDHPSIFRPLAFSASSRETCRTVCAKLQT